MSHTIQNKPVPQQEGPTSGNGRDENGKDNANAESPSPGAPKNTKGVVSQRVQQFATLSYSSPPLLSLNSTNSLPTNNGTTTKANTNNKGEVVQEKRELPTPPISSHSPNEGNKCVSPQPDHTPIPALSLTPPTTTQSTSSAPTSPSSITPQPPQFSTAPHIETPSPAQNRVASAPTLRGRPLPTTPSSPKLDQEQPNGSKKEVPRPATMSAKLGTDFATPKTSTNTVNTNTNSHTQISTSENNAHHTQRPARNNIPAPPPRPPHLGNGAPPLLSTNSNSPMFRSSPNFSSSPSTSSPASSSNNGNHMPYRSSMIRVNTSQKQNFTSPYVPPLTPPPTTTNNTTATPSRRNSAPRPNPATPTEHIAPRSLSPPPRIGATPSPSPKTNTSATTPHKPRPTTQHVHQLALRFTERQLSSSPNLRNGYHSAPSTPAQSKDTLYFPNKPVQSVDVFEFKHTLAPNSSGRKGSKTFSLVQSGTPTPLRKSQSSPNLSSERHAVPSRPRSTPTPSRFTKDDIANKPRAFTDPHGNLPNLGKRSMGPILPPKPAIIPTRPPRNASPYPPETPSNNVNNNNNNPPKVKNLLSKLPAPPAAPTGLRSDDGLDPAWTYYKSLPVPPPPPKLRKPRGNTLRLSQKRHDAPIYNSVQILGTETKQDFKRNKPYTVYVIQATSGVVSWTVYRRFREFYSLQSSLVKKFPDIKFSKSLPPKKLIGTSLNFQFVSDRTTQLEAYLRQMIDLPEVCRCQELLNFMKDQSVDVQDITLQYVMGQDIDFALKLLSSSFGRGLLRDYAVSRWEIESDSTIQLYLLQLVQALRSETPTSMSKLPSLLISRGVNNPLLGNFLHWHLTVERDSSSLIFAKVHEQFKKELLKSEQGLDVLKMLMGQNEMMNFLSGATTLLISTNKIRQKKIKKLRKMFNPSGFLHKLTSFPPLRFPLDPTVLVTGIVQDTAYLFKSALSPLLLQFKTSDESTYTIIFKKGDDLRQDQLITQIVALMDTLLQKEGLDLKLTPYKVLATARDEGFVQHIPSVSFAAALEESNFDLQKYWVTHNPDPEGEYGFSDEILDNFVRSSAGYCVITFILGIGDRHLDNVLLTPTGRIFHIDFGYIMDFNPPMKFAPPMKLSKEMIDAMGGVNSRHYHKFIELSIATYKELRKHADLITNLLTLMADSGIKDIMDANDIIPKLQKKFRMDLQDDDASAYLLNIINESVSAVLPQMVESIHRWAQQRRN